MHIADRHLSGDAQKVPQPHLLHPLLPKPLHCVALVRHVCGLCGNSDLHRGVEQHPGGAPGSQNEEGGVTQQSSMDGNIFPHVGL